MFSGPDQGWISQGPLCQDKQPHGVRGLQQVVDESLWPCAEDFLPFEGRVLARILPKQEGPSPFSLVFSFPSQPIRSPAEAWAEIRK